MLVIVLGGCTPLAPSPEADRSWTGSARGDLGGWTLAVAPVRGDLVGPIAIGAPGPDARGSIGLGRGRTYRVDPTVPSGNLRTRASFTLVAHPESSGGARVHGIADLDADGDLDLVSDRTWYDFEVDGEVEAADAWGRLDDENLASRACGDLDADGFQDLCAESHPRLWFGPLSPGAIDDLGVDLDGSSFPDARAVRDAARDFDGDGYGDVVLGTEPSGALILSNVQRDGTATVVAASPDSPIVALVDDLTGDGEADLLGFGEVFTTTSPTDAVWALDDYAPNDAGKNARVADLNGDGRADLVLGLVPAVDMDDEPTAVAVFLGPLPAGRFRSADADLVLRPSAAADAFGFTVEVADLDGDGRTDLVVGAPYADHRAGAVHFWSGAGLFP